MLVAVTMALKKREEADGSQGRQATNNCTHHRVA